MTTILKFDHRTISYAEAMSDAPTQRVKMDELVWLYEEDPDERYAVLDNNDVADISKDVDGTWDCNVFGLTIYGCPTFDAAKTALMIALRMYTDA